MQLPEAVEKTLDMAPDLPGVYLMKDAEDAVIYVGKARSLRKRLRQHFRENRTDYGWTSQLYPRVMSLDYVITDSELEALLLEASLIKEHRPKYNIRLSDDKSHPYLKLTDEPYPRLLVLRDLPRDANVVTRRRERPPRFHDPHKHEVHNAGGEVFGPYADARSMRRVMRLVPEVFGLRSCARNLDGTPNGKPCLNFHIERCVGPCRGSDFVSRLDYAKLVRETVRFLEGRSSDIAKDLEREMKIAAAELAFEKAGRLRDKLKAIQRVTQDQVVVATEDREQDVIAASILEDRAMVVMFEIRAGRLVRQNQFVFGHAKGRNIAEVLDAFLTQHYTRATHIPAEILLADTVIDQEEWAELLSEIREARVWVHMPERGEKRRLVELAAKNAEVGLQSLARNRAEQQRVSQMALSDLADAIKLPAPPRRIECYDISTTQGKNSTGSQVVFADGRADKKSYRHYRMRATEGKPDDFAMLAEMVGRRLDRGIEGDLHFLPLPDLILVDGGKGQLSTVLEVLKSRNLETLPLISLAKQEEEVFVPGRSVALDMRQHQPAQMLLMRIRDEAHRFAITHHRGLRDSQITKSVLDDAPGIGPTRKRSLLQAFASVQAISNASVDELAQVKGMNLQVAKDLLEYLQTLRHDK